MKRELSVILIAIVIMIAMPVFLSAQTATPSIQTRLETIANLKKQIESLKAQIQVLEQQRQDQLSQLVNTLKQGSTGNQVKVLQALLAADFEIYPEGLITGYYGPATSRAVKKIQKKFDLDQVGSVGPKTLKKLNELLKDLPVVVINTSTTTSGTLAQANVCHKVPPGHLIAPGWLRKNNNKMPVVPPCQTLPPGISAKLGLSTTTPDGTAPIISSVAASAATSTAIITWTTNEAADSQVIYGLTSSYGLSTSIDSNKITSHSQALIGLAHSTVYHFSVKSADASANMTSSTDQIFTTSTIAADTAAPVISGLSVTNVSSTSTTVSWNTNEQSTSKVYYSTASPVDLTSLSTPQVSNPTPVTSHSLGLTGLTASSTYFFVVESIDGVSNRATSTQQSFVTMQ